MSRDILGEIQRFGATRDQLIDLAQPGPRTLRFADLVRAPEAGRAPVVVESQGRPLVYVFDGRHHAETGALYRWIRRIAFRGDADWVGVLRPGRLDIHPAVLDEEAASSPADGLPEGSLRIPELLHKPAVEAPSVRLRLRSLLFASIKRARDDFELRPRDALALVGGSLFWRFLVDRNLLDGLDPSEIAPNARSWTDCLDTKKRALATFRWLHATFNGGVLEFEKPPQDLPAGAFSKIAGDIAHKTDAHGQLSLPEEWAQIDFAHVPVGLLSEVYEAVAHDRDRQEATERGLFYTPRHIAEYMVDEVLEELDELPRPRVLDPAAGAGVFLVAAFRTLVAREWERTGIRPSRTLVRRVLNEQLVGFDVDADALRLAELALYLTAIELDPEDRPRPLDVLRFADLRGRVLVEQRDGNELGSLGPVVKPYRAAFDAVIGNPPWTAMRKSRAGIKKEWVAATRPFVEDRLGGERAAAFDFPDANPDLPFVYRAMEWARPEGAIGLITHARWLFGQSPPAVRARRDLLESVHVTGILNAAALRSTKVWPNVSSPFCILFAKNERPPTRAAFQFVSPELDTHDSSQDRIRIDWRDAEVVEVEEVVARPWTLKARFRGDPMAQAVLEDVERQGVPLGEYLSTLGTDLYDGCIVAPGDKQFDASHLRGLPELSGTKETGFVVDPSRLPEFSRQTLHRPRSRAVYGGPLLLLRESPRADRLAPRALRSESDVLFPQSFHGASFTGVPSGLRIIEYLQLILQSDLAILHALLTDPHLGVEREQVHLESTRRLPVLPYADLTKAQRDSAKELARALGERRRLSADLASRINTFVARLYGLSDVQQEAILDTVETALPTRTARNRALERTTPVERSRFAAVCKQSLQDVLSASDLGARVEIRDDLSDGLWRFVQIDCGSVGQEKSEEKVRLPMGEFLKAADEGAASLVSLRIGQETTLVGLLDRYRYWTPTRARLLASILLAEGDRWTGAA